MRTTEEDLNNPASQSDPALLQVGELPSEA